MKKYFAILFLFLSFTSYSQLQKGIVIDAAGNPIKDAYLLNSNSKSHAHTDEFGNFGIDKTNISDVLIVSALGCKKIEYTITILPISIVLENDIYLLDQVVIQSKLNVMSVISKIDLETNPVNSSQEILRKVPGLFIGQHAGGGKAEQLFLRGFDVDHGTDIAIDVDGIPVNMVSHAHGQGYADLHFVIPETIEKIDFGKGTYFANRGDFATAGYVDFQTKDKVDKSYLSFETGQFNMFRTLGIFNLLEEQKNENAYLATEYILTDGPFESPQNFKRINLFGKYISKFTDSSKLSFIASVFSSKWDASGQIPQRLIDNGTISRFGAVDNTEGGITSRTNFNVSFSKLINENTSFNANTFYSKNLFELYSNFTFFLEDPINGDQIKQKENRNMYGLNAEVQKKYNNNSYEFGFGFRADGTKNTELSNTLGRYQTLQTLKLGDIDQTNIFSYINASFYFGKFEINPGLRLDYLKFDYQDKLSIKYKTQTENKTKLLPKLNFIFTQNNNLQFFLKSGLGFHSNDTRVVVEQTGKQILPTAFGTDLGTIFKITPSLIVNTSLWMLDLEQEFVYVGDAAIVEPSGKSFRAGIEMGLRYQFNNYFLLNTDINYTHARSKFKPIGQNYIPLAPDFTSTLGLSINNFKGFSGGYHFRYLKSRPANEDNSIVAKGYMVTDMNVNYKFKYVSIGFIAENIFNTKWNETQFATQSRLQNEIDSVEEIHFTPGTPFYLKGKITYYF
jgi:hypothetical protein